MSPRTRRCTNKLKLDVKVHVERLPLKHFATISKKKLLNKSSAPKATRTRQQVRFNDAVTNAKHALRKRKTKNYAEISIAEEKAILNKSDHVPIYLKHNVTPTKKLKDPFEFVIETPKACCKDRESFYDKDTHDVLMKLEAKEKTQQKLAEKKQLKEKQAVNNTKKNKVTVGKNNNVAVCNKQDKPRPEVLDTGQDVGECFGFGDSEDEAPVVLASRIATYSKAKKKLILTSAPPSEEQQASENVPSSNSNKVHIISNIEIPSKSQPVQNKNPVNSSSKMDDSIGQEFLSRQQVLPAATSTPHCNTHKASTLPKSVSQLVTESPIQQNQNLDSYNIPNSPWRSDSESVSRHPYFLAVKTTSLPSYNQDMILNSEVEQSGCKSTTLNKEKSLVQTTIPDFIEGYTKPTTPRGAHNQMEQSLFDNSDFSPIKRKSPGRIKRNVFGVLTPSTRQNLPVSEQFRVDNYFGFDSVDENKENPPGTPKSRMRAKTYAQPTRIVLKEAKNCQKDVIDNILENKEVDPTVEHVFPEAQDDDAPAVALFEDLEVLHPQRRSYERKRPRRVRIKSVDSDSEPEETIKPKSKHKDVRTPAEEAAYKKWIAQFNAMCEEVENHTLVTE